MLRSPNPLSCLSVDYFQFIHLVLESPKLEIQLEGHHVLVHGYVAWKFLHSLVQPVGTRGKIAPSWPCALSSPPRLWYYSPFSAFVLPCRHIKQTLSFMLRNTPVRVPAHISNIHTPCRKQGRAKAEKHPIRPREDSESITFILRMKLMAWGIIIFPQVEIKHQTPNLNFFRALKQVILFVSLLGREPRSSD